MRSGANEVCPVGCLLRTCSSIPGSIDGTMNVSVVRSDAPLSFGDEAHPTSAMHDEDAISSLFSMLSPGVAGSIGLRATGCLILLHHFSGYAEPVAVLLGGVADWAAG